MACYRSRYQLDWPLTKQDKAKGLLITKLARSKPLSVHLMGFKLKWTD